MVIVAKVINMKSYLVWTLVLVAALTCPSIQADDEDVEVEETSLGTQVDIVDFPSLLQVEFRVDNIWVPQCVGNVLTSRHFLATARCFSGSLYNREDRRIRVGTAKLGEGGEIFTILREYIHPSFGLLGFEGDLTVVRLNEQMTYSDSLAQGAILGEGIYLPVGLRITLASWGNTAQGAAAADSNLYSLDLYTQNEDNCLESYYSLPEPMTVTENMVCAGFYNSGRDLDEIDLGAPLFFDNVIVGIISFGQTDANNTIPIVSTAIASYTEWIRQTATY